jgi:hypothetical protein
MANKNNVVRVSKSTHPEKIFIYNRAVEKYGLLKAAVVGELYFWFVNGKKGLYRRYEDHAIFFQVEYSCISNAHKTLTDEHNIFKRRRGRSENHGGLLSYHYSPGSNDFCRELMSIYAGIFDHSESKSDLGDFCDPDTVCFVQTPKVLTVLTSLIDEFKDLTTAYIYSRLCWVNYSEIESNSFNFKSMVTLSDWLGLDRSTVRRRLLKLERCGYLSMSKDERLNITLRTDIKAYDDYQDWVFEVHGVRADAIIESNGYGK